MILLVWMLRRLMPGTDLVIVGPSGKHHHLGPGGDEGLVVRLVSPWTPWRLILDPPLAMGEAYIRGELVVERGTLAALLDIVASASRSRRRAKTGVARTLNRLRSALRRHLQHNTRTQAAEAISLHYDIPFALFDLTLDKDHAQYSCAYYQDSGDDLDDAQRRKIARIAAKLRLENGQSLLEIGCGWGGLSRAMAKLFAIDIRAISLSRDQIDAARQAAAATGQTAIDYAYCDYRDEAGVYDRIVSIAMFEAVGLRYYPAYFERIVNSLEPGGVVLVHTIGRLSGPGATDSWTDRHIFPGGYAPALSEILSHIEAAGLLLGDLEIWQDHYAETLRAWHERLQRHRVKIAAC